MKCPKCRSEKIGVVKTTSLMDVKLRIRICYQCGHAFETVEKIIGDYRKKSEYSEEKKQNK